MTDHEQTRFHDGEIVSKTEQGDPSTETKHIEPGEGTGFRVEAKSGALDTNAALRSDVEEYGNPLRFTSEHTAVTYADQLSATEDDLRLQTAALNDPRDIEAYHPRRSHPCDQRAS